MPIKTIKKAILGVLEKRRGTMLSLQEMYLRVPEVYNLSKYQKDICQKYGGQNIESEIRSLLARLVQDGVVEKPQRGYYRIK